MIFKMLMFELGLCFDYHRYY